MGFKFTTSVPRPEGFVEVELDDSQLQAMVYHVRQCCRSYWEQNGSDDPTRPLFVLPLNTAVLCLVDYCNGVGLYETQEPSTAGDPPK